ncbi:low affinity iron permease family protein [Flavobacterium granuli]|uniref:Low affinity Fe/Cu permease n=1 Tax=Flavobacterium granuli TaxID=280093 RepID=A0ABU1RY51_9FLAO|nr:low affinity iron permease family protein [Flavobacterium granuli]MDR6843678.1 low affinity Fe/Cu permease [Flavobacterium granuli]
MKTNNKVLDIFEKFSMSASKAVGSSMAFGLAFLLVLVWAICGPIFDYSETWQLVINTTTTIITFLMVFLIQKAQNKDSLAIQLKLNELVASNENSSNRLVDIESMTEEEMMIVQKYYHKLGELSKVENVKSSHSIEEAQEQHKIKNQHRGKSVKKKNAVTKKSKSESTQNKKTSL